MMANYKTNIEAIRRSKHGLPLNLGRRRNQKFVFELVVDIHDTEDVLI